MMKLAILGYARLVVALVGGAIIALLIMGALQRGLLQLTNPMEAAEPLRALATYEYLVKWVAHPLAAIGAGIWVGYTDRWLKGGLIAVFGALAPLWASWLRPELMGIAVIIQALVYALVAALVFMLTRNISASPAD